MQSLVKDEVAVLAPVSARRDKSVQTTSVLKSLSSFDLQQADWETLADSINPLLDFAYFREWATRTGSRWLYVFASKTARGAAFAPLAIQPGPAGRLHMLAEETFEILDFPHNDEAALTNVVKAALATGRPLLLDRIHRNSLVVQAIQSAYGKKGLVVQHSGIPSPWIALDETWREPESKLNSGRRQDLRRARRNAEKLGAVEFEIVSPAPSQLPELLDELYAVESRSWKGTQGTALVKDTVLGPFYRRFAERMCHKSALRLCFLRIGQESAAAQFAVVNSHSFSLLKTGYDEKFAKCSPGTLLTQQTIRYAAAQGFQTYEFNGSPAPWIEMWTKELRESCSIRAYPWNARGLLALAEDSTAAALKRIRSRFTTSQASK